MAKAGFRETANAEAHASAADFERIFTEDMGSLYLLSLLLAGDRQRAEECFVAGVDESTKEKRVFKGWARSWARRAIIRSAIRLISPEQDSPRATPIPVSVESVNYVPSALKAEVCAILELAPLERFVFVMSVLERYSEHDCSILLGCSRKNIAAALARALQHLGGLLSLHRNETEISSEGLSGSQTSGLVIDMTIVRYFATPSWKTNLSL
jgi:DNA-directed RNA polymerase specialized sigma24 family protein